VTAGLDPALFRPEAIDAQTAAWNAQIATVLAGQPHVSSRPAAETRALREAGLGPFGPLVLSEMAVDRTMPGASGPIRLRTFVPQSVQGVYLHLHGGGWTLGGAHHTDLLLERLAKEAQLAAVSVEYRLAPEHPYPSGPDDCEAAAVWLIEHAKEEFGSDRLVIGGESAGGHLAANTLVRLRDKHGYTGFKGANLTFGAFDLSSTPSQRSSEPFLVLDSKAMEWFSDQYVPAERRREPDVSPLYADLRDLPPALFTVGTADPLLDDSLFMYMRWMAASNEADLAVYPGAVHGFVSFPYPQANEANRRINEFLGNVIRR
jgi:acetyl esterase/lipase